jgi:hypothetical protein
VRDRVQLSSNDDGTLMSRIVTRNVGEVSFALDAAAVVRTPGMRTLGRYFRQRMRWASVRGRFLDRTIYAELVLLFLYFTLLAASTILVLFEPRLATSVVAVWVMKLTVDWVALQRGCRPLRQNVSFPLFVLAQVFHPIGILLSTLLSFVLPFSWKGRRFNR